MEKELNKEDFDDEEVEWYPIPDGLQEAWDELVKEENSKKE